MIHTLSLKKVVFEIYRPLRYIVNLSINQGIFPDNMKLAKVVPIFKRGSRFICNNYRHISVRSSISKIFEKSANVLFYEKKNSISTKQYGFRPGITTADCPIDIIEEITSSLDQGHYVSSTFMDLSKAFDTVNHQILLNKLKFCGLQQNEYNWLQSYLSNRKHQVYVNVLLLIHVLSLLVCLKDRFWDLCCLLFFLMTFQRVLLFPTRLYPHNTSLTASGSDLDSLLYEIMQ